MVVMATELFLFVKTQPICLKRWILLRANYTSINLTKKKKFQWQRGGFKLGSFRLAVQ